MASFLLETFVGCKKNLYVQSFSVNQHVISWFFKNPGAFLQSFFHVQFWKDFFRSPWASGRLEKKLQYRLGEDWLFQINWGFIIIKWSCTLPWEPTFPSFLGVITYNRITHILGGFNHHFSMGCWGPEGNWYPFCSLPRVYHWRLMVGSWFMSKIGLFLRGEPVVSGRVAVLERSRSITKKKKNMLETEPRIRVFL